MHRPRTALTAVALLGALTACGPDPTPEDPPPSPSTAAPSPSATAQDTSPSPSAATSSSAGGSPSASGGPTPAPASSDAAPSPSDSGSSGPGAAPTASPAPPAPSAPAPTTPAPSASAPPPRPTPSPTPGGLPARHTDPASLQVLVNKHHPLPAGWSAPDLVAAGVAGTREGMVLRRPAAAALQALVADARQDGITLVLISAHRTHAYQAGLYQRAVEANGRAHADRYSARPGHSEHQTGLTVDLAAADGTCTLHGCFADTPEGRWIAQNAVRHGFVVRYPAGAEAVTGYAAEPWHLRYLGVDEARRVRDAGGVAETAWGAGPAPGYLP